MTDVIKRINNSASIYNGASTVSCMETGKRATKTPEINNPTHCSGYLTYTTNGYLDTRFDDKSYYLS